MQGSGSLVDLFAIADGVSTSRARFNLIHKMHGGAQGRAKPSRSPRTGAHRPPPVDENVNAADAVVAAAPAEFSPRGIKRQLEARREEDESEAVQPSAMQRSAKSSAVC
mmetsp:Transcript_11290/g.30387  ORF Transcript_11290/g.30387 Transcript_11290/m.30387 type:complete len:109 (-) Transcript_11290:1623-1949(-)